MRKTTLFIALSCVCLSAAAQNVGVGTASPSEKLEVNGNINIQGNVKVNGVSGQNGQVLRTNSSGATQWSDLSDYKNHVAYSQNSIWNVPAGVTKVMIEAWGGGGGGAEGGGGASGSYMQAINVPVIEGILVNIVIGNGGIGATSVNLSAENGGHTMVTVPNTGLTFTAYGGGGAFSNAPGLASSVGQTGFFYQFHIPGNNGETTRETYHQYSSTEFVTVREYGNGGDAVMVNGSKGGKGRYFSFYNVSLFGIKSTYSTTGRGYGGGGGGGLSSSTPFGANGGAGIVIIHY